MEELSFLEKLTILWNNILAHPIFILLLLSPVLIFALNKKITKKFIIAIYIAIILIVLFVGNGTLFALFDNVIDGLFMSIYFPNFITLFVVEVASAIITLITFTKRNMLKINKIINIVGFAIVQTLFCLILTVVQVNELDIYKENTLYSNSDVLTLMQLFMAVFVLQVMAILIFNAIEKVTEMLDNKDERVRKYRNIGKSKGFFDTYAEELFSPEPEILFAEDEIVPLDKSLIKEEKIIPISLDDAIDKEQRKIVEEPKVEIFDKLPEAEIKEDTEVLEISANLKDVKSINAFTKVDAPEIFDLEPNIENEENSKELDILPNIMSVKEEPLGQSNNQSMPNLIETLDVSNSIMPNETKQVEDVPAIEKIKEEPEELITNLVIINLTKTILGIRDIKRIYTM